MRSIAFVGHDANHMAGTNIEKYMAFMWTMMNDLWDELKDEKEVRFITGGDAGTDQVMFWTVYHYAKRHPEQHVINDVYLPYHGKEMLLEKKGSFKSEDFADMIKDATNVIYASDLTVSDPYSELEQATDARNKKMVDDADELMPICIAVDPYPPVGMIGNMIRYAKKQGKKVNPVYVQKHPLKVVDKKKSKSE